MNVLHCRHITFVPDKMVDDAPITNCIYVYSRKMGKRINKNKVRSVGIIRKNQGEYCLLTPNHSVLYSNETLDIIHDMIGKLNKGLIRFNPKKGTLKL